MTHTFKPYADNPELCVAELPCGDTCNQGHEYHTTFIKATFDGVTPGDADIDQLRKLPETTFNCDFSQQDNTHRANRIAKLIVAYTDDCFGTSGDEMDTILGDFMSDFRHLLDAIGVDLYELIDASSLHYEAEIRGVL